ncbi:MAG: hypothetical protein JNM72_10355 [Deltaproteobacteria bacterium]|nr:hypothetical protein [Deltaproteobacteria bacterium]
MELPDWEVLGSLGEGANARVLAVRHRQTGARGALKQPRATGQARVARELALLRGLALPCLPRVLDAVRGPTGWWVVLERIEGQPWPGGAAPLPPATVEAPLRGLLLALDALHGQGLLHLDLKPEHVILEEGGGLRLLDLGLAAAEGAPGEGAGSPGWAAPEVWAGRAPGPAADLFAVGLLIVHALTGQAPPALPGARWSALDALPALPPGWRALIDDLLHVDPDARPASARGALGRIGAAAGPGPALPCPAGPVEGPADLRALFWGPDRVFHLQTDAADALWARAGGAPERILAELGAWVAQGLARVDGARLRVSRAGLDHLAAEALRPRAPAGPPALPAHPVAAQALAWLWSAGAPVDRPGLLALLGCEDDVMDVALAELAALGAVEALPTGAGPPTAVRALRPPVGQPLPPHALGALAGALPQGSPERLGVLLRSGAPEAILEEALALAAARGRDGRLGLALAVLEEVLPVAEERGGGLGRALLLRLAGHALATGRPGALDRAARAAGGGRLADPAVAALLRGFGLLWAGSAAEAFAESFSLDPLPDADLEDWRVGLGVMAASAISPEALADAVARAEAERQGPPGPDTVGRVLGWRAQLHYAEERHLEAAALHRASAEGRSRADSRAAALLGAASAWLAAGALDEAEADARAAAAVARACRLPMVEARAEWRLRERAYRAGVAQAPDEELLAAVAELGAPALQGLLQLNEAAVAWRAGRSDRACALAQAAAESSGRADAGAARALSRALALRCGAAAAAGERGLLQEEARALPWRGITAQILGLIAQSDEEVEEARRLGAELQAAGRSGRLEVLGVDELRALPQGGLR